jgi:hypothetical protein
MADAASLNRFEARTMSCDSLATIIRHEGAVVLWVPSKAGGGILYDRYVASARYCMPGGRVREKAVASSDRPDCPVMACT